MIKSFKAVSEASSQGAPCCSQAVHRCLATGSKALLLRAELQGAVGVG